jgi:DNA-binding transcriptional regulator YbjK
VDHDLRREELTEALWRVVRRSGIHAVSVRAVAREAGTSPSALRHYFASTDELLGFGLTSVVDRVRSRLIPRLPHLKGRSGARTVLEQLLPLDEQRQAETEVYLAFIGRAHTDPALRRIRDDADEQARAGVRAALELLRAAGELASRRDLDEETNRLYALVDGLAMHGALLPDRYPRRELQRVLDLHLEELARD